MSHHSHNRPSMGRAQHFTHSRCLIISSIPQRSTTMSVENAVIVVRTRARESGTGFIPGQCTRLVSCGKTKGAGTFQLVLETPTEKWWFLGYFVTLGMLAIIIMRQANHGVSLWKVPTEGGTLCRLKEKEKVAPVSGRVYCTWKNVMPIYFSL